VTGIDRSRLARGVRSQAAEHGDPQERLLDDGDSHELIPCHWWFYQCNCFSEPIGDTPGATLLKAGRKSWRIATDIVAKIAEVRVKDHGFVERFH
jgi:hypothetical protein